MHAVRQRGWHGVVVHFRGCSGEANRLAARLPLGRFRRNRLGAAPPAQPPAIRRLFAAGVSLGGNALLKWAAELGEAPDRPVAAIAAVSVPLDLAAANQALSSGFNLIYARHFLRTLIPAALEKNRRFPGRFDIERARVARSLRDFDDAVTAPLHGFAGADDYYARSSAGPLLKNIRLPTLLLHAVNDPFLPVTALPHHAELPTVRAASNCTPRAAMSASCTARYRGRWTGCRPG
jgi:predicted alpha/beta-fold hydrolase